MAEIKFGQKGIYVLMIQKLSLALFLSLLLLSACTLATVEPTADPSLPPTEMPLATATIVPPAAETPTDTPMPTPTLTATPNPDFTQAKFISVSLTENSSNLIIIEMPGLIGEYRGEVKGKSYECKTEENFADKLFCTGPAGKPGDKLTFFLYPVNSDQWVFQAIFSQFPIPTPTFIDYRKPGYTCEVEPLWNMAEYLGQAGCYAVTCINEQDSSLTYGTPNTCTQAIAYP